jgi:cysteine desulfurase
MSGYFDYNATCPLHPAAREAWLETSERFWQNPSSLYREAGAARQRLEDYRDEAAMRLGCEAEEMVFLSGATEANNAVIAHAAAAGWERIAVSAVEHPCVLEPAEALFPGRLQLVPVGPDGRMDLEALKAILQEHRPGLVALMAANNETGILQPWQEARQLCEKHGALFHCDAAQWIGKLNPEGLGECDFLTGSAHKFGGPKGIGFLKVPQRGRPLRWLRGGPQEERRRAGTENLPGIAAMMAAWAAREAEREVAAQTGLAGRTAFEVKFRQVLPEGQIIGADAPRLWNTVLMTVPAPANLKWLTRLSARGFAVSTGSACSRGAGASDVLRAMGVAEAAQGQVLRLSAGWSTTAEDWLALAEALAAVREQLSVH